MYELQHACRSWLMFHAGAPQSTEGSSGFSTQRRAGLAASKKLGWCCPCSGVGLGSGFGSGFEFGSGFGFGFGFGFGSGCSLAKNLPPWVMEMPQRT